MIFVLILSSFVATSGMTLFSYLCSYLFRSNFSESELINHLWRNARHFPGKPGKNSPLGWVMHYVIGLLFVVLFILANFLFKLPLSFVVAALGGLAAGIIAVVSWYFMFFLNPNPPKIKFIPFYIQLLIAHIIFALIAFYCYSLLK